MQESWCWKPTCLSPGVQVWIKTWRAMCHQQQQQWQNGGLNKVTPDIDICPGSEFRECNKAYSRPTSGTCSQPFPASVLLCPSAYPHCQIPCLPPLLACRDPIPWPILRLPSCKAEGYAGSTSYSESKDCGLTLMHHQLSGPATTLSPMDNNTATRHLNLVPSFFPPKDMVLQAWVLTQLLIAWIVSTAS